MLDDESHENDERHENDGRQVEFVGEWKTSSSAPGFVGKSYRHSSQVEALARYRMPTPRAGRYEVLASHTAHPNRTVNAQWRVVHRHGETLVCVNQRQAPPDAAHFVALGEFEFDEGVLLELSRGGKSGVLVADAVRLRPLFELPEDEPGRRGERDRLLNEAKQQLQRVARQLKRLRSSAPKPPPQIVCVADQPPQQIGDCRVRVRGNHQRLGETAPRGVLQVAAPGDAAKMPKDASGRLQLARWIASPQNPLTSRVLVNRVWSRLFGAGLVRTVDNFGSAGSPPTHPQLLDYLALRLVQQQWSLKRLIREIVLSRTYMQADRPSREATERDPENLWLSHQNRRRLDAEAMHDSLLAVSGRLEDQFGGDTLREGTQSEYGYAFELGRARRLLPGAAQSAAGVAAGLRLS